MKHRRWPHAYGENEGKATRARPAGSEDLPKPGLSLGGPSTSLKIRSAVRTKEQWYRRHKSRALAIWGFDDKFCQAQVLRIQQMLTPQANHKDLAPMNRFEVLRTADIERRGNRVI